jgi:hypothetical protein
MTPRCATCRKGRDVRTFHDHDASRRRCPDCRRLDPVRVCPLCDVDLLAHDLCAERWGWVIR